MALAMDNFHARHTQQARAGACRNLRDGSGNPASALSVDGQPRSLLGQLRLLLHADLVAVFPGEGSRLQRRRDGEDRGARLLHPRGVLDGGRNCRRQIDPPRNLDASCPEGNHPHRHCRFSSDYRVVRDRRRCHRCVPGINGRLFWFGIASGVGDRADARARLRPGGGMGCRMSPVRWRALSRRSSLASSSIVPVTSPWPSSCPQECCCWRRWRVAP